MTQCPISLIVQCYLSPTLSYTGNDTMLNLTDFCYCRCAQLCAAAQMMATVTQLGDPEGHQPILDSLGIGP